MVTTAYSQYVQNRCDVNMPYGQPEISLTINYVRLSGRYQMLNDGDDGVLPVRLGTVVTQMMPYRLPGKEEL